MTARPISFLKNTLFGTGQAAASLTALRLQDVADTMGVRTGGTYGTFVRVTDPEFGADPTGQSDSTVAFQNAMAAGVAIVPTYQSSGARALYRLQNCVVPTGATLIGEVGGVPYGLGGGSYQGFGILANGLYIPPMIAPLSSTTPRIFNVDGKGGITFRSLLIDCSNVVGFTEGLSQPCDIVSAGGRNMNFDSVAFFYGKNGIGGQVAGSIVANPTAQWIANVRNCVFDHCVTGLSDLVDAHVSDCWFSGCFNGVSMTPGGASVTFTGCRYEWCGLTNGGPWGTNGSGGNGALFTGSGNINIIGGYFDVNGNSGLAIVGDGATTFPQNFMVTACMFQANGSNCSSGTTLLTTSCHINLTGATFVQVTDCGSWARVNPAGVYAPAAFCAFGGASLGISFVGNNLSGYVGSTAGGSLPAIQSSNTLWRTGTPPATTTGAGATGYIVQRNFGTGTAAQDIDSR